MPTSLKKGKPYLHVTWIAKLLGGNECYWSVWFRSRHYYDKFEEQKADLVEWSRQHNELMAKRRRELERQGYTVTVEQANDFKIEGDHAVLAGKPDIVATKDRQALVVDGKTGRQRESDIWQVLIYLWALPKKRPELATMDLEGEVQYARGDERISVTPGDLTTDRMERLVHVIKTVSAATPPARVPSRYECQRCNVGPRDCPQRVSAAADTTKVVGAF